MRITTALLCSSFAFAVPSLGVVDLTSGEVDVGINYDLVDAWDFHIHDEINELEYEPDEAQFVGRFDSTLSTFIFPQIEDPSLPYIGIGTEELQDGIFVNDEVTLKLVGLVGPGNFRLTQSDPLGGEIVYMDSSDGFATDAIVRLAGTHDHFNWEFSAIGTYTLEFEASGTLVGGGLTSGRAAYTFVIAVPEPATLTLIAGAGALALFRRR